MHNIMQRTKRPMKKLLLILLLLPLISTAQESSHEIQATLTHNSNLIDQFAQLAPMGINPYVTVFMTSLCAKIGFHNEFVATNPFFNNWIILILFGILFLFTALVGTIFKTNKATAPIALADNYLSNHAALIINGFIMLTPTLISNNPMHNEIVYQAGLLSINFKTILILMASMYFLIVVMSVRFFIDILIFLSPIPLVDSFLEIFKIIISMVFVIISIINPLLSVTISVFMFLIAIIFYRRSIRLINKTKYLILYPILNIFRNEHKIMTNGHSFSILTYVGKNTVKMKRGKIVRLEKQDDKFFLIKRRFLLSNVTEEISFANCFLSQNHLNICLTNETGSLLLILNRSYHNFIDDLAETLNIKINKKAELKLNLNNGYMDKLRNMFNKKDIADLKSVGK